MRDDQHITRLPRRLFLERSGIALLGTAALAQRTALAAAGDKANPFGYDVSRFEKTDPALVRYEVAGKFSAKFDEPNRIATAPGNRILVATRKGVSLHLDTGALLKELPLAEPARCAAQDIDERIFVGLRDHLEVFDATGNKHLRWDSPATNAWLTAIAVSGEHVFAADSGNRVVWRYDKTGKVLGQIGKRDREREIPGLVLPSPYLDISFGADGLLRVNNPGRHVVEVYTPQGELELSWGTPGAGIRNFCGCCNPIGLALLPDGRCVTCEKGLPRVKLYSAKGEFECVVAGAEMFPGNAEKGALLNKAQGRFGGMDAAVDDTGRIYILDLVSGEVTLMRPKA